MCTVAHLTIWQPCNDHVMTIRYVFRLIVQWFDWWWTHVFIKSCRAVLGSLLTELIQIYSVFSTAFQKGKGEGGHSCMKEFNPTYTPSLFWWMVSLLAHVSTSVFTQGPKFRLRSISGSVHSRHTQPTGALKNRTSVRLWVHCEVIRWHFVCHVMTC